jgi:uncharacterized membrane protein YccC
MGICILLGALAGHVVWGLLATAGGFTSLYVHNEPYAQRSLKLAVVGVALAASFALGTVSAAHIWSMAVVLGLVSMAAMFFAGAYRLPPPGGYFFILVCALGTGLPVDPAAAPLRFGLAMLGSMVAWAISMAGWTRHPHRPEITALANAFREVAAFLAASSHIDAAKHNAAVALQASEAAVSAAREVRWRHPGTSYRLFLLHEKAKELFLAGIHIMAEGSRGSHPARAGLALTTLQLVDAIGDAQRARQITVPTSVEETPAQQKAYRVMNEAVAIATVPPSQYTPLYKAEKPRIRDVLRGAVARPSAVMPAVLRMGIVVTAATVIAHLFGDPRPYWVPLTCASILQGATTVATVQRSVQRAIGTVIGLGIGVAILSLHPNIWAMTLALMVCQWLAELFIVRNYGLAMVVITPLPLILAEASYPSLQVTALAGARLENTILGCVIGILGALLLWRRASSTRLPQLVIDAIRLEGRVLDASMARTATGGMKAMEGTGTEETGTDAASLLKLERALQATLLNIRVTYDAVVSEIPLPKPAPQTLWPVVAYAVRLGYSVLAVAKHETDGLESPVATFGTGPAHQSLSAPRLVNAKPFNELAKALEDGHPLPKLMLPDVSGFSTIRYDWTMLQETLQSLLLAGYQEFSRVKR